MPAAFQLNRRRFLQSAAAAGFGLPLIQTTGLAAPSERLRLGCIGVGGKGWSDMNETAKSPHVTVQAICDIDEGPNHMGRAAELYPKATRYTDWRELLDKEKLDAVTVSTPDHMHAPIALSAMRRGLHVYCQKPLTHTVKEARVLANAAKEAGVVTQMGRSTPGRPASRAGGSSRIGPLAAIPCRRDCTGTSGWVSLPSGPTRKRSTTPSPGATSRTSATDSSATSAATFSTRSRWL
jgi:hypothetical protein